MDPGIFALLVLLGVAAAGVLAVASPVLFVIAFLITGLPVYLGAALVASVAVGYAAVKF